MDLFTASGIPVREYVCAVQAVLGRTHDDEGGCVREGVRGRVCEGGCEREGV